ncbi:MAG: VCBS repeat-containing protein [Myxococcales bacterium]|nr:hypothetical protein [Sorangiineae bacterium PRO1]MCL4750959.1 VCBS repeat-containing protein [Myxococcales bacterium]
MSILRWGLGVLGLGAAVASACGGDDGGGTVGPNLGGAAGDASLGGSGGTGGGVNIDTGTPEECNAQKPCEAGVCVGGKCCASLDQACGASCCNTSEVCLFEQCIVPGKSCQTAADCAAGEYCETALGTPAGDGGLTDGGAGDGGAVCTQPVPANGKCVKLPPICQGDAGAPDGGTCVEQCEYHPPSGVLTAVKKWQWGTDSAPKQFPNFADVWATPTVARVVDANCDGKVDETDPPNVIFVSGNAAGTCCSCNGATPSTCLTGKLRVLDGQSGQEIWTLDKAKAGAFGFAGLSVALGDVTGDQKVDIVTMTGDGFIAVIDNQGKVVGVSDKPVDSAAAGAFGWGGGIAIADMDGDGSPEVAYGRNLFSTKGGVITRLWVGTGGNGGGAARELSFFVDLNGDGKLELLAGNTAYKLDGTTLWNTAGVGNGFNAVADFDGDAKPEAVVVQGGKLWVLEGATGVVELGPLTLPSTGEGGPPTVADFDGDGKREIGVAQQALYTMVKPDYAGNKLDVVWTAPNHDLSSSVTGSSVFDFDGDGKAEVVYNDECFLWVYDGQTGKVLFATQTTSFTATEASLVADVDGDGHSEILMVSNGADPSAAGWKCNVAPWNQPDAANNRPAWVPPAGKTAYRGITAFGDKQNSWVGTRTVWNQHAYSVSNVCDSRDSACDPPNIYGSIPLAQKPNWTQSWLNNFRQNVQDKGIFDAPDVTVKVDVSCSTPIVVKVSVRNIGLAGLPAGVTVAVFVDQGGTQTQLGTVVTTKPLLPGQTEVLDFTVPAGAALQSDGFFAKVVIDPNNKTFNECRDDNNQSAIVKAKCGPA